PVSIGRSILRATSPHRVYLRARAARRLTASSALAGPPLHHGETLRCPSGSPTRDGWPAPAARRPVYRTAVELPSWSVYAGRGPGYVDMRGLSSQDGEGLTPMISFGTDGWRGVIDDDFTEANAALVVQAAAEVWAEAGGAAARERPLVVGYDTRFNSARVATQAAEILAANGWRVLLADRPVPTPLVSFSVVTVGAAGGLVVTASHNPARFNGIKLKGPFG